MRRTLPLLPGQRAPEPRRDRCDPQRERVAGARHARQASAPPHRGRPRAAGRRHVRPHERDRRARAGDRHARASADVGRLPARADGDAARRRTAPACIDLRRDSRFRYVLVLKNHGAVWSRYPHAHSHVIATPFTPKRLEEELAGAREYYRLKERCAFCDQLDEELRARRRVVARQRPSSSPSPRSPPRTPTRLWISPRQHAADFGPSGGPGARSARRAARRRAARACGRCSTIRRTASRSTPAPLDGGDQAEFHWHWEIVPHLGERARHGVGHRNLLEPGASRRRPPSSCAPLPE